LSGLATLFFLELIAACIAADHLASKYGLKSRTTRNSYRLLYGTGLVIVVLAMPAFAHPLGMSSSAMIWTGGLMAFATCHITLFSMAFGPWLSVGFMAVTLLALLVFALIATLPVSEGFISTALAAAGIMGATLFVRSIYIYALEMMDLAPDAEDIAVLENVGEGEEQNGSLFSTIMSTLAYALAGAIIVSLITGIGGPGVALRP